MKRIAIIICFFTFFFISFYQQSFAQDTANLGLGLGFAYNSYSDDSFISAPGVRTEVDFQGIGMPVAFLTYYFRDDFSIESSVGIINTEIDITNQFTTARVGEIQSIPISLLIRAHGSIYVLNTLMKPYLGIGGGYYINDLKMRDPADTTDMDNSFFLQGVAGIEYYFTDNFTLDFSFRYLWNETKYTDPSAAIPTFYLDMDAFVVGLGFKYYF